MSGDAPATRTLVGFIDALDDGCLGGWARSASGPVTVTIERDGRPIARGIADRPRADLGEDVGFRLHLPAGHVAQALIDGSLAVTADDGTTRLRLDLFEGLRGWLLAHLFVEHLPRSDPHQIRAVLGHVQSHLLGGDRDYAVTDLVAGAPAGEMTAVTVPVGLRSWDGDAVVGRDGHLFLLRGSNDLIQQYRDSADDPAAVATADAWAVTIAARARTVAARGATFLQCIVPEKSTLLRELFPVPIPARTAIMSRLATTIEADPALGAVVLDGLPILSDPAVRAQAFQKIDTHLAPIGAHRLAVEIGRRCGAPIWPGVAFDGEISLGGDVGRRLLTPHARQAMPSPGASFVAGTSRDLVRVAHDVTPTMTGTRVVFHNPGALCRRTVVAFANSFFDVGTDPTQVSWWLARMFSDYHFIWSPDLDLDYVAARAPAIVLCQTIERFLSTVAHA